MIEGRIFTDPGILYGRAYIVHKSFSEAPMSNLRQSIAQSYILPHCYVLFFCWVFLKMCMTSFHASFKLWDFRQEDLYSYPVHTHAEERQRNTRSTASLGCCSLGAIENKDKRTSNCCAICHLVLLGCFCICLKTTLLLYFIILI